MRRRWLRPSPVFSVVLIVLLPATFLIRRAEAQAFTEINSGLANTPYPCVVWGDYDADGDVDLLEAGLGRHDVAFSILYRNDGGTFVDSGVSLLGLSRASAAWGDLDGDGDLDLAMTGLTTAGIPVTVIYRNDGGTFVQLSGSFTGVFAGNVAWGDYDCDGDLDLLVTGVNSAGTGGVAITRLYRNDGGVFTSAPHPFPDCYLGAVAWGDYDNDGRTDVFIAGTTSNAAVVAGLWHNDGGGVFTDAGAGVPGMDLGFACWGDYDNDGDLDLLFGGNSNEGWVTRIYRNDGGSLVDSNAGLLGLLWSSAAWGDYDNDGDLDAMVFGYDAVAQVPRSILYRNDAGLFVDSGLAFHNLYLGTLSWADYDNDGDLDLLLAGNNQGQDITSLYRNDASAVNLPPEAPGSLAVQIAGTSAILSWSRGVDDHTPATGLGYNLRVGTTPGGSQIVSPEASAGGYRRLPALGNVQSDLSTRIDALLPGTYFWSVQSLDTAFSGSPFAAEGTFIVGPSSVPAPVAASGEGVFDFAPNPFTTVSTLRYSLSVPALPRIEIFDASGRLVRSLTFALQGPGMHAWEWDGRAQEGSPAPPGVYFARLEAGEHSWGQTLIRVR